MGKIFRSLFNNSTLEDTRFRSHLLWNLTLGLVVIIILTLMQVNQFRWLVGIEDSALDWMMSIQRGAPAKSSASPLAFLEIDESAYRELNEPFYIPRSVIVDITKLAEYAGAKIIIIDIDISRSGFVNGDDEVFVNYLREYPPESPPIVLIRTFHAPDNNASGLVEPRISNISDLENIVDIKPNIAWASTLFPLEKDGSIRRWRLWETVCKDNIVDHTISVQLLVSAVIKNNLSLDQVNQDLKQQLNNIKLSSCENISNNISNNGINISLGDLRVELDSDLLLQRFIYSIPWQYRRGESPALINNEFNQELSITRSVYPIVIGKNVNSDWLKERIVVIGGSFWDTRDIYSTPLGKMPGALILVNSINSLLTHGLISRPAIWIQLSVLFLLIIILTIIFSRFTSTFGVFIANVVVVLLLIPLSIYLFASGVWLNFALPILTIQIHEIISTIKEEFEK